MIKGRRESKDSRRITISVIATISPNETNWGRMGGCLGFLVYLFSGLCSNVGTYNFFVINQSTNKSVLYGAMFSYVNIYISGLIHFVINHILKNYSIFPTAKVLR
jgi:hypothetical protein